MKTTFTSVLFMVMLFLLGGMTQSFATEAKEDDNGHPNFTWIDDWNFFPNPDYDPDDPESPEYITLGVTLWWAPEGSGSTAGHILEDDDGNLVTYRAHETEIVNPHTGSTGSMKLAIQWDNDIEYIGTPSHLIRQHLPAGTANTPERRFQPGQALEVFLYGDGSGNRFRFMTRDGIPTLEGSQWMTIDWTGWKRITWNYNDPDNVVGWVNGDGVMDGENFYFDSFQITKDAAGTATGATLYFDDLRIVDPFNVVFDIAGADGSEVISINNITFDAGDTDFMFFPGIYEFFVHKEGFETYVGSFEVDDQDLDIDIVLTEGDDPEYTVTFTVMDPDGDLITDAIVTIEGESHDPGEYVFDLTPGFYNYVVSREFYFDTEGYFTVTDGNVFENVILEEIPDVYDNVFLSWDVAVSAATPQFKEEYYSVWIGLADENGEFDPEDYVMIFDETMPDNIPNWTYQPRSIEISGFQQENIRVAFRHHDVTDKDRILISNVKVYGYTTVEDETEYLLHEDFAGGVPADFDPEDGEQPDVDPEWLPEGWEAIDHDGDGHNWYYEAFLNQDMTIDTYMISRSWDGANQVALTPDNWLITPVIQMPWVVFHTVTFEVVDDDGNAIEDAVVVLDGEAYDPGHYEFSLTNGTYHYEVHKEDHESAEGSFVVEGESKTIEVVLTAIEYFSVTFNVNMSHYDDFVPGETEVYITGTFPGWEFAEPGTFDEQLMEPTDNIYVFTRTLEMPEGVYYYKYFDGPSYDVGEWPGDPNREIEVTGDMEVNNVFGHLDDDVLVPDTDPAGISLFPNPASHRFTVTAPENIHTVTITDITGRTVQYLTTDSREVSVDTSGLLNGMYIVRIYTESGVAVSKLQVQQ